MNPSALPYRQNVCMLIYKDPYHIFMGERAGERGVWQFPQGGVEDGLTLEENVLKEIHEELGANPDLFKIERKLSHQHKYDFDNTPAYAVGRFRGQEQSFWLVKFLGEDSDINLEKSEHEFQSWCWTDLLGVEKLAEPKRLAGYLPALQEFKINLMK